MRTHKLTTRIGSIELEVPRLMGAVAMEYNDQLSMKTQMFAEKTSPKFKAEIFPKMKESAANQQALLDAA